MLQSEGGQSFLVSGDLSGTPIASGTVHPLHHSDPLVSHFKLTSFSHNFSRILVGQNFGVSGTNYSPPVIVGPDMHHYPCLLPFLESPSLASTSADQSGFSGELSQICIS